MEEGDIYCLQSDLASHDFFMLVYLVLIWTRFPFNSPYREMPSLS